MMVMDVVNRAAIDSGAASTFNEDEVPEDMQARGAALLRYQILPELNGDRNLDITEVSCEFQPVNGTVTLRTTPETYERAVFEPLPLKYAELVDLETVNMEPGLFVYRRTNLIGALVKLGLATEVDDYVQRSDKWPVDRFGKPLGLAIWTDDFKLVLVDPKDDGGIDKLWTDSRSKVDELLEPRYNIPFPPSRVSGVFRAGDGAEVLWCDHGEFVGVYRDDPLRFTDEDYEDRITIRLSRTFGNQPVTVVLPVPLKIVNTIDHCEPWEGEIHAPAKFESYLTNYLAWLMAVEYGLSTKEDRKALAEKSYQNVVRNKSTRHHQQDIDLKIQHYLRNARGTGYGR